MARKRIESEPAEPEQPAAVAVAEPPPVEPAPVETPAEPVTSDAPALPAAEPAPPGWSFREPVFGLPVTGVDLRLRSNGASMVLNLLLVDPPGGAPFAAARREVLRNLESRIAGRVRDSLDPKALANFAALREQLQAAERKAAQADAARLVRVAELDAERQRLEASDEDDLAGKIAAVEDAAQSLQRQGTDAHRAIGTLRQLLDKRREALTRDIMAAQSAAEREERQRLKGERAALYAKVIGDGRQLSDLAVCETALQRLLAPHVLGGGTINTLLGLP